MLLCKGSMTQTDPIAIVAQVTEAESPAARTGAAFLASALRSVSKAADPPAIALTLAATGIEAGQLPPAQIYILSIREELEMPNEPIDAVIARWTSRIRQLQSRGAPIFLCTVFRHARGETLARIRKLNLAVVRLSHSLSVSVIDVDRVLAHYGVRVVGADHTLQHPRAIDAAGHAIARTILASSLDTLFDPVDQENALNRLGGLEVLPAMLRQREEARLRQASGNG